MRRRGLPGYRDEDALIYITGTLIALGRAVVQVTDMMLEDPRLVAIKHVDKRVDVFFTPPCQDLRG